MSDYLQVQRRAPAPLLRTKLKLGTRTILFICLTVQKLIVLTITLVQEEYRNDLFTRTVEIKFSNFLTMPMNIDTYV